MNPDFGKTASDYARYRAGFPDELFLRLEQHDIGLAGQRVLDIGTGTGTLARRFALRGCQVTGLDISPELLNEAEQLDAKAGVKVDYVQASAENIGSQDNSFDVVTAGVCWHWLDPVKAANEVLRVLVPGGHLVIAHFDWLSHEGNIVEQTERLISQYCWTPGKKLAVDIAHLAFDRINPEWSRSTGTGIHPDRLTTLDECGYVDIQSFSFDVMVPYSHKAWRGRIRSHADVGAGQSAGRVRRLDDALRKLLEDEYPEDRLQIPHRVFAVIGRAPAELAQHARHKGAAHNNTNIH